MPLHPSAVALLNQIAQAPPLHLLPVAAARQMMVDLAKMQPREEVASVIDRHIPGLVLDIPIRVYRPASTGQLPVLVYFHGGGWVVGNLDTEDHICRALANGAQCIVVSVNYRHAPEHKFPAAPDDAYAATRWVAKHAQELGGDATRLAIGGYSAGANLSIVTARRAQAAGFPTLRCMVLRAPPTSVAMDTTSHQRNGTGYGLERDSMLWFWQNYLSDPKDGMHPDASPALAPSLQGLPPAMVLTAEFDPLQSEGEAFAEQLQQAGVSAEHHCYAGMTHLDQGPQAITDMARYLHEAFARS